MLTDLAGQFGNPWAGRDRQRLQSGADLGRPCGVRIGDHTHARALRVARDGELIAGTPARTHSVKELLPPWWTIRSTCSSNACWGTDGITTARPAALLTERSTVLPAESMRYRSAS
ncbi:hypothetical protein WJM95_34260 [Streptomyces sp. f51]|uniref:hypothetical protein n=1 Tax=Streptomyces sp. f51 TaxID=1827742 RepID=UPI0030CDB7A7